MLSSTLQSWTWISISIVMYLLMLLQLVDVVHVLHDRLRASTSTSSLSLEPSLVHFRRAGQAMDDDSPGIAAGRRLLRQLTQARD